MEIGIRHTSFIMLQSCLLTGRVFLKCWDSNFRFHSKLWSSLAFFSIYKSFCIVFVNMDTSLLSVLTTFLWHFLPLSQSLRRNKKLFMCFWCWGWERNLHLFENFGCPHAALAAACSGEMEFSAKSAAANFNNFAKERLAPVHLMACELLFFLAKLQFHTVCVELLNENIFFSLVFKHEQNNVSFSNLLLGNAWSVKSEIFQNSIARGVLLVWQSPWDLKGFSIGPGNSPVLCRIPFKTFQHQLAAADIVYQTSTCQGKFCLVKVVAHATVYLSKYVRLNGTLAFYRKPSFWP